MNEKNIEIKLICFILLRNNEIRKKKYKKVSREIEMDLTVKTQYHDLHIDPFQIDIVPH